MPPWSSCRSKLTGVAWAVGHGNPSRAHDRQFRKSILVRWKVVPLTLSPMSQAKDIYFVIGGSGFVGRHIVQQLLKRGDNVSVFDIVQRYHDTPFYSGDISDQDQVASALRKASFLFSAS